MSETRVFKNIVRQEATPSQKDWWKRIIPFGKNDNFPLRLARLVQQSPTASSCIDTKTDFIIGGGFSDPSISKIVVNKQKQTFGDIHALISASLALFDGFSLNIKYNLKGSITEIYSVPFEYCRFDIPDENGNINIIRINPYFGTSEYLMKYTKNYNVYNPNPVFVFSQMEKLGGKYPGQLLYFGQTSPLSRFYPVPSYFACSDWMAVDEAIGGFQKHNIENGFFQSVVMKMIGDNTQPSTHPDDMTWNSTKNQYEANPKITVSDRLNIEMQKFSGWEKAGNIMVQWARNKEELPDIQPFPTTQNSELYKALQDITTENICKATKIPSILANIQSGSTLGGDGNNVRASVKLMQQRVLKYQDILARTYQELFTHFENPVTIPVKILNYDPFPEQSYKSVDKNLWDALTMKEKRNWIKKNTDYEILTEDPDIIMPDHPQIPTDPAPIINPLPVQPQLTQNSFSDIYFSDYPQGAKDNCQKARDYFDKMRPSCGTKMGWQMNDDILASRPLSFKQIKRIYNFLNKKRDFANGIFSQSCDTLLFHAWGGMHMFNWAGDKIKSINE